MRMLRPVMLISILFIHNPAFAQRPDHVVVVVEENKSFNDIIGNQDALYINQLASQGALMMESYAIMHPSLPNYIALFSGSTHGIKDDGCNYDLKGENLAQSLHEAGFSFKTFSETMPHSGFTQCGYSAYRKKHNPLAYFDALPGDLNQPFRDFPGDFARLPTIAFVIPNMDHDMHDGTVAQADGWLRKNIAPYVVWAESHNSLLVLTWDEDDDTDLNHIVTIFVGAHVKPGKYSQHIDHYDVLRTLAMFYGVRPPNNAAKSKPVTGIWAQ